MITDPCGDEKQDDFYPYHGDQEEDAVNHRAPHQQHRDDFSSQGDGFILAIVADVGTEVLLADQPVV